MTGRLEIVIPVYNEGDNIVRTLEEIEDKVRHPHRILVVYDFEGDSTLPPLRRWMRSPVAPDVRLVRNHYGKGALNAIRSGVRPAFIASISTSSLRTCAATMRSRGCGAAASFSKSGVQRSAPRSKRSFCTRAMPSVIEAFACSRARPSVALTSSTVP